MSEYLEIPKFTVDLSQPPETRYDHIVPHFKTAVDSCDLPSLFYALLDELVGKFAGKILAAASPLIMRRVHSDEEIGPSAGMHEWRDNSTIPERQSDEAHETGNVSPDLQNQHIQQVLTKLSTSNSTAAYLILCQPDRVFVIEKDHRSASIRESDTFLTAYNHDVKDEDNPAHLQQAAAELAEGDDATGMADLVAYSLERKHDLDELWRKRARACKRRYKLRNDVVTGADVIKFLQNDMIRNEETHYAVIMDPKEGKVTWRRAYEYVSESEGGNTEEN
ncbi:hypothetical protein FOC1_g10002998 [Fusarium oxysporum f. sp. cubense race 1]|uniref:Acid ceramidase N-terminal domain-containing protein n=1 Tax=Fusarium oxysporum f. sp. cubense (strain race 1) TaxID=1229664 RepID=N4V4A9_FUSC1|nr:hypothetical protein FOC1_g10002998 [Fusarium oxysporum f. sp. cubense race 1]